MPRPKYDDEFLDSLTPEQKTQEEIHNAEQETQSKIQPYSESYAANRQRQAEELKQILEMDQEIEERMKDYDLYLANLDNKAQLATQDLDRFIDKVHEVNNCLENQNFNINISDESYKEINKRILSIAASIFKAVDTIWEEKIRDNTAKLNKELEKEIKAFSDKIDIVIKKENNEADVLDKRITLLEQREKALEDKIKNPRRMIHELAVRFGYTVFGVWAVTEYINSSHQAWFAWAFIAALCSDWIWYVKKEVYDKYYGKEH